MAEAKKLGELLKEVGLIDDFQLQSALSHQRNWGGKLGAILVELEFVREEDVAKVIAEKMRMPYANLFEPEIPETVIKLIKEDVAKKYVVMPVKKEAGRVIIAMSDPLDMEAIDELRFITGLNIAPALALESEIKLAIRKYYDHEEVVRKRSTSFKEIARFLGQDGDHPRERSQHAQASSSPMPRTRCFPVRRRRSRRCWIRRYGSMP